ncbi:MAG: MFS transporter, partial [Pseudomonadota bacterium]
MFEVLSHPVYRRLFGAQVIALVGTGLATIALALLAHELAGAQAGAVLGTALAIKMIAYVVIAPIASAVVAQLPRRSVLVALDLVRAGVALCPPFVTQIWEVYLLIFLLQSASAGFTPTFQAVIPDLFDSEERYTNALSLSRLAYDLENLLSPLLAAALLTIVSFNWLFMGTSAGFLISAALVLSVTLPRVSGAGATPFFERLTSGARSFFSTPRLRGLMAINLAVAAGGSFVIINTVVLVQSALGLSEQATALAFAAFGAGSMVVALTLPRLLTTVADRPVMLLGAGLLSAGTALAGVVTDFAGVLALWFCLGLGSASAQLPAGRLLRRSA